MAAGTELTPTSYINHHLSHLPAKIGDGGFMTLHVDTVVTSILLGIIGFGLLRWIVAGATAGVPRTSAPVCTCQRRCPCASNATTWPRSLPRMIVPSLATAAPESLLAPSGDSHATVPSRRAA